MGRFPCDRSLNSFTTCDRASFSARGRAGGGRRRIGLSEKNRGREVVVEQDEDGAARQVRGVLSGWAEDGVTVFVTLGKGRGRRVAAVPASKCRLARRKVEGEAAGKVVGELPLFEARDDAGRTKPDAPRADPGERRRPVRSRDCLRRGKAA